MKSKKLEILSIILQILYGIHSMSDIVLCFLCCYTSDDSIARTLAYLALNLTGSLFVLPTMPIGIILNICALRKRKLEGIPRKEWMVYTILSPIIYIIFFLAAVIVFVSTTGGV